MFTVVGFLLRALVVDSSKCSAYVIRVFDSNRCPFHYIDCRSLRNLLNNVVQYIQQKAIAVSSLLFRVLIHSGVLYAAY